LRFYRTGNTLRKYSLWRPTGYWDLENNRLNVTAGDKYGYHWNFSGLNSLYNSPIYVQVSKVVDLPSGRLVKLLPAGPPVPYVRRERILHSVNCIISVPVVLSVARFNISVDDAGNRNKKTKSQPALIDPQIL